jgi:hypothetical protein
MNVVFSETLRSIWNQHGYILFPSATCNISQWVISYTQRETKRAYSRFISSKFRKIACWQRPASCFDKLIQRVNFCRNV